MARSEEGLRKKYLWNQKYKKETYVQISFRVRKDDTIVLNKLQSVGNRSEYIMNLIRKDIENSGK